MTDIDVVLHLCRQGNTIEAIRRYKRIHGCSLLEAKTAVEALCSGLKPIHQADKICEQG
jgi:ribosomal protein L7/L12